MKIRLIWKFIPVPIFITNWLIPSKFAGYHIATLALVRPTHKDDEGLIQHELTHVKQNLRTLGVSGIRQLFDKNHKLNRECEAYAVQLQYVPPIQRDVIRPEVFKRVTTDDLRLDVLTSIKGVSIKKAKLNMT